VSTERTATFRPERPYRLSDHVVLRPEPFGGLAYDLQTRRLLVLRDPALVALLAVIHDFTSAAAAVSTLTPRRQPATLRALAALEREGLIRDRG
jgi:putative mycofactocin binding protein MftB